MIGRPRPTDRPTDRPSDGHSCPSRDDRGRSVYYDCSPHFPSLGRSVNREGGPHTEDSMVGRYMFGQRKSHRFSHPTGNGRRPAARRFAGARLSRVHRQVPVHVGPPVCHFSVTSAVADVSTRCCRRRRQRRLRRGRSFLRRATQPSVGQGQYPSDRRRPLTRAPPAVDRRSGDTKRRPLSSARAPAAKHSGSGSIGKR
jgi:hypothetical protein